MVLPNASRFARTAGLGTKLRRRLACGIFKCAAEVAHNPTFQALLARDSESVMSVAVPFRRSFGIGTVGGTGTNSRAEKLCPFYRQLL
jgi:hypothetical protein